MNVADSLYDVEIHTSTQTCSHHNTKPLLLDAVVVPITESSTAIHERLLLEAREECDNALLVARQCRDLAETAQAEKRDVKYELEKRVEVVRDFWRSKVVEGGSRSGLMLRASLLRK